MPKQYISPQRREKKEFTGFSFDMLMKHKQLSHRTIGPTTRDRIHNGAEHVKRLYDMKRSKLCSGIRFDEDEQILDEISVQSFTLYDVFHCKHGAMFAFASVEPCPEMNKWACECELKRTTGYYWRATATTI